MQRYLATILAFLLASPMFAPAPRYAGPAGIKALRDGASRLDPAALYAAV